MVYLTLFVSILLFSQSLFAQGLKMQQDRSLEPENRIETKTKVKVQDNNEFPKLEEKRTATTGKKNTSQEMTPNLKTNSGSSISSIPIEKKEVNSNDIIAPIKVVGSKDEISSTTIEKREVNPNGVTAPIKVIGPKDEISSTAIEKRDINTKGVIAPAKVAPNAANTISKKEVNAAGNIPVQIQKNATTTVVNQTVVPMTSSATVSKNTAVQLTSSEKTPFYDDALIKSKLKQTDAALYQEYLKERVAIISVLNRVEANTFKNATELTKYTQLLNQYKQKYNF